VRDQKFRELLAAPKEGLADLAFEWKVPHVEFIRKAGDDYAYLKPDRKPVRTYLFDVREEERPFVGLAQFMSRPNPQSNFYESVYGGYEGRIRDEIVDLVEKVENELPMGRQSYGMITELDQPSKVIGTVRVSDGTLARSDDFSLDDARLPFERIFKARGSKAGYQDELDEMRNADPFRNVFEIGKLTLEGSVRDRDRSLKAMELFLLTHYIERYPDATFVVHVASEAHLKLYQKRYDFEIKSMVHFGKDGKALPKDSEVAPENLDHTEWVLALDAKSLEKAIRARLGLPPR
jgi:hypothetical protein